MPITLEPLTPSTPPPAAAAAPRWARYTAGHDPRRDPRGWLIIREGAETVGWLRVDQHHPRLFSLIDVEVVAPERERELGYDALDLLAGMFPDARLEAATWHRHSRASIHQILSSPYRGGRFRMYIEKVYVRRALGDFTSPYEDRFALVSLTDAGEAAMISALGAAMAGSPARDLRTTMPEEEFHEMRLLEGDTHDPEAWSLALLDGEIAGVILANRFPLDDEGTFTFIGVTERFRGRGLGKVLHARGLEVLQAMRLRRYLCSTDVRNTPMMRLYAAHGCAPFDIRRQYVWEPDAPVPPG